MQINKEIVKKFSEMAVFLVETKQKNAAYRAKAYRSACRLLENVDLNPVPAGETFKFLRSLGLGEKTATKAVEIIESGSFTELEELRKLCAPIDIVTEIAALRGVGEKLAARMVARYGFKSMDEVKSMVESGQVTEKTLIKALERAGMKLVKRWPRAEVEKTVEPMIQEFKDAFPGVRVQVCGSYRRGREHIKDVDILICGSTTVSGHMYTDWFANKVGTTPRMHGPETLETVTQEGLMIDIRVVPADSWGAGLVFLTGPREYNIDMRTWAKKQGFRLNRYGLFSIATGENGASKTEMDIFEVLGLNYQTPEEREQKKRVVRKI